MCIAENSYTFEMIKKVRGFLMVNFFMWGGFIFCAIWHVISLLLLWADISSVDDKLVISSVMNVGLSGISLCYFGMLAFK